MKVKPSTPTKRHTGNNNVYLFKAFRASWPETEEKIKVKLGRDNTSFSEYFHAIDGTETPELFMLWLQEFQSKGDVNPRVAAEYKLDVLIRLVKGLFQNCLYYHEWVPTKSYRHIIMGL